MDYNRGIDTGAQEGHIKTGSESLRRTSGCSTLYPTQGRNGRHLMGPLEAFNLAPYDSSL